MSLRVDTEVQAADEVVTLAQAKAHMRVSGSADDDYIASLLRAAREQAEHKLRRSIGAQILVLQLDEFPHDVFGASSAVALPRPPAVSVTSVKYIDSDGVQVTMDSGAYVLDAQSASAWLLPAYGTDWPATREQANAVQVKYVTGYTPSNCPATIVHWVLMVAAAMYELREAENVATTSVPEFARRMIDRYQVPLL